MNLVKFILFATLLTNRRNWKSCNKYKFTMNIITNTEVQCWAQWNFPKLQHTNDSAFPDTTQHLQHNLNTHTQRIQPYIKCFKWTLWFSPQTCTHHIILVSMNFMNCTVPTFYDYSICKILTNLEFGIVHLWQDISWSYITHGILAVLISITRWYT